MGDVERVDKAETCGASLDTNRRSHIGLAQRLANPGLSGHLGMPGFGRSAVGAPTVRYVRSDSPQGMVVKGDTRRDLQ